MIREGSARRALAELRIPQLVVHRHYVLAGNSSQIYFHIVCACNSEYCPLTAPC